MLYGIFPIAIYATIFQPEVDHLPIEVLALVLRYLDGESLLRAAKASKKWKNVIIGDPILRKKLKDQLEKEQELRREFLRNPQQGVRVERQGSVTKMFARNNSTNKRILVERRDHFDGATIEIKNTLKRKRGKKTENASRPSKTLRM